MPDINDERIALLIKQVKELRTEVDFLNAMMRVRDERIEEFIRLPPDKYYHYTKPHCYPDNR